VHSTLSLFPRGGGAVHQAIFAFVNGIIFTKPPYNFSLSPVILTIIGELISGPLNDWFCVRLATKNHGIYEPEFRPVLLIPTLIFGCVGFFGFGLAGLLWVCGKRFRGWIARNQYLNALLLDNKEGAK
jgi:hypothetical protein